MIASVRFNARRKGSASSRLAPMPLNSRNGGRPLGPGLTATSQGLRPDFDHPKIEFSRVRFHRFQMMARSRVPRASRISQEHTSWAQPRRGDDDCCRGLRARGLPRPSARRANLASVGHQLPFLFSPALANASPSGALAAPTTNDAFGLVGGSRYSADDRYSRARTLSCRQRSWRSGTPPSKG